MKTVMNKLTTVKNMSLLALVLLVALGLAFAGDDEIGTDEPAASLTGTTEHEFVGHLGTVGSALHQPSEQQLGGPDRDARRIRNTNRPGRRAF